MATLATRWWWWSSPGGERKRRMEGENSRQGCEFERLGVDDIYARFFLPPPFITSFSRSSSLPSHARFSSPHCLRSSSRTNPANASPNLARGCSSNLHHYTSIFSRELDQSETKLRNDFIDQISYMNPSKYLA